MAVSPQIFRGKGIKRRGVVDKPSVVSELQHKLLKHCRGKPILTSESYTAQSHKHTQHKKKINTAGTDSHEGEEQRGEGRGQEGQETLRIQMKTGE